MKTKTSVYILSIFCLISCGQKNTTDNTNKEPIALTEEEKTKNDSIGLYQFELYQKGITHENYQSYNRKVVADFEKNRDTTVIRDFLKTNISKIFGHNEHSYEPSDLIEYTHSIDINNDGDKDIIYQGPSGGEANMTVIFLHQRNLFLEVFRQYQDIFEIEFKDNKLSRLSLTNPGCCLDPQVVDYFYQVVFNDSKPKFELSRTTGYLSGYEKPESKFRQEKKITITKNEAKLRNECYELDTEHPYYGENGNILTTYQKGSTGKALAEKNDKETIWLYVIMDPKSKFDNNDFPTFKEQPTELYGWIKKDDTEFE